MHWGAPVPAFGDVATSRVATLGLNPSNREFVDVDGNELHGNLRRFHTLSSLGLQNWQEARGSHVEMIIESCKAYFRRNPYDAWFKQLDFVISGTRSSYYCADSPACHLDLIPFATHQKWTTLPSSQRKSLINVSVGDVFDLLQQSPVQVIVLNGRTVVEEFQKISNVKLICTKMPDWSLRRGKTESVPGYAYLGRTQKIGTIDLRRELLVLGYNHNIQSSFGVTNEVRKSIRDWISAASKRIINETRR